MKVILLNGSANQKGCTYTALEEIGRTLQTEGIGYEIFQTGARPVRDCIGCGQCTAEGCVFSDDCEFPYKSRVMPTSEPLKSLKAPYMARNPMKWGFFRLKRKEMPL